MIYDDTVTLFNYHAKTGSWRTTVFEKTHLLDVKSRIATRDSGFTNNDSVELIIRTQTDRSAHTRIYKPHLILTDEGDTIVDSYGFQLSYIEPDTDEVRAYVGPKSYANLDDPSGHFTFAAERDFFMVGNHYSQEPIDDDDYDEGLYHAMNDANDGVYMVTTAAYFGLIPHFEIGGR